MHPRHKNGITDGIDTSRKGSSGSSCSINGEDATFWYRQAYHVTIAFAGSDEACLRRTERITLTFAILFWSELLHADCVTEVVGLKCLCVLCCQLFFSALQVVQSVLL